MIIETEIGKEVNRAKVECQDCVFMIDAEVPQSYNIPRLFKLAEFVVIETKKHKKKYPDHTVEATLFGKLAVVYITLVS